MSNRFGQRLILASGFLLVAAAGYAAGSANGMPNAYAEMSSAVAAAQVGDGDICWHISTSDYRCTDSTANTRFMQALNNTGGMLVTQGSNGRLMVQTLPPTVDAIFLSKAATEMFLLQYYMRTPNSQNTPRGQRLRAYLSLVP